MGSQDLSLKIKYLIILAGELALSLLIASFGSLNRPELLTALVRYTHAPTVEALAELQRQKHINLAIYIGIAAIIFLLMVALTLLLAIRSRRKRNGLVDISNNLL